MDHAASGHTADSHHRPARSSGSGYLLVLILALIALIGATFAAVPIFIGIFEAVL